MSADNSKPGKRAGYKRNQQKKTDREWHWIAAVLAATFVISGFFSFVSGMILKQAALLTAFAVLLVIVLVGIIFDMIGVAVTAAASDASPYHGMAARKVPGAEECLLLLKNAARVSSFCNDVIGDICGVVSGSAAATIAAAVLHGGTGLKETLLPLMLSALVAASTVGGKAAGKTFAMRKSTEVLLLVGGFLYRIRKPFRKNGGKKHRH